MKDMVRKWGWPVLAGGVLAAMVQRGYVWEVRIILELLAGFLIGHALWTYYEGKNP